MKIIENKLSGFTEKYPLLNGDRHLKIDDPTIVQNKATGRLQFTFQSTEAKIHNVGTFTEDLYANLHTSPRIVVSNTNVHFIMYSNSYADLVFKIPYNCTDGGIYDIEIIVDGVDNRILVNEVVQIPTFTIGTKTTSSFIANNIIEFLVGNGNEYDRILKGNLTKFIVYDTDLTTVRYSLTTNGTNITASSPTTWVKNTTLELNFNNSLIDISDTPKTVTAYNSPTFVSNRYGIALSAINLDGINQYLGISGGEINKTVSFWINPTENNRDILQLSATAKISLNSLSEIVVTGLTNPIIKANRQIKNNITLNTFSYVSITFDEHTCDSVIVGYSITYFKGIFDSIEFRKYSISNEELKSEYLKSPST